jgi:hypothetical protein
MRDRRAVTTRALPRLLLGVLLAAAATAAHAVDIKVATVAPDGSRWMQQMRAGAEEVNARTSGRVTLKFYPGGVMGNDAQVLRKIRIEQREPRRKPLFASPGLMCCHRPSPLSVPMWTRLGAGLRCPGVTSVTGFRWTR